MTEPMDTDDALQGNPADVAEMARQVLFGSPRLQSSAERDRVKAWLEILAGITEIKPSPAAVAHEIALIGDLIVDPKALMRVGDIAKVEDFSQPKLAKVYQVMLARSADGTPLDVTSVVAQLNAEAAGVADWPRVAEHCRARSTGASTPAEKATAVAAASRMRQVAALAAATYHRAIGSSAEELPDLLDEVSQRLADISDPMSRRDEEQGIGEVAIDVVDDIRERSEAGRALVGPSTGFRRLDSILAGFEPGALIIIKAGTGVGKTGFALTLAHQVADASTRAMRREDAHQVAYFSMEMANRQLGQRILARESGVDGMKLRMARLEEGEPAVLCRARDRLIAMNNFLRVIHRPGMTVAGIRRWMQRASVRWGCAPSVVFIDYVQLLGVQEASGSREQDVAKLSTSLKEMAGEFGTCMVALSQINAEGKARESRRIEQDADAVIQLKPAEGAIQDSKIIYDILVEKNRHGITLGAGQYQMLFLRTVQQFVEATVPKTEAWWDK